MRDAGSRTTAAPGLELGELGHTAGFLMRIAQLTAFERIFNRPESPPVGLAEFTVMTLVAQNPQARQGEIADALKIKWPRMTKLIRSLEERGLVERVVPKEDRRAVMLRLTTKGKRLTAELRPKMEDMDREVLSMLSREEHAQLVHLLKRVIGWEDTDAG